MSAEETPVPTAIFRRTGQRNRFHGTPSLRAVASTAGETYSADEMEFMLAMDQYKRDNRRPFPTWSEVLSVVLALGYRKGGASP